MKELLDMFFTFARIGGLTFGGGYAMLPMLQKEVVERRGWATEDELMDYYAVGQCTPGVIALNVSTFIGYKRKKIPGALAATIGFLTIPIMIILVISAFLTNFADLPVVKNAFAGIRVCVCVLIFQAVLRLWKKSVPDNIALILYLVIFAVTVFSGLLPVKVPAAVLVITAGIFGVIWQTARERRRQA